MEKLKGVFAALATPFYADETINFEALGRLIERDIAGGVAGFYVCGSTGETYMLALEERKALLEAVVKYVSGRCSIIANVGAFALEHACQLAKHAAELGVDAISSVPPFYFPFCREEILDYYMRLAGCTELPVLIYNVPALSGVSFSIEELFKLLDHPQIAGIKQTSMNLYQTEILVRAFPEKSIVNGHDEVYLPALSVGVESCIGSTIGFMPEMFVELQKRFMEGDIAGARAVQGRINNIVHALNSIGVFKGVKAALKMQGIDCGNCRRPFLPLSEAEYVTLEKVIYENLLFGSICMGMT